MTAFAIFIAVVLAYALVSRRLSKTALSAPMVLVAAGMIFGSPVLSLIEMKLDLKIVLVIGEIALALTLFNDAARMNLAKMRGSSALPARMLGIGLPLTIAAGTGVAMLLFTDMSIFEAAILGTVLAPTDAGLGKKVVNSPRIPIRIRQTLNIEAGLNDGIAVPFLLIFIALAEAEKIIEPPNIWRTFATEIGFGLLVGLAVGLLGGLLVRGALKRDWVTKTYESLFFPSLALIAFLAADMIGGSGFIAAFAGGLIVAQLFGHVGERLVAFIEAEGQLVNLAVFFVFGVFAVSVLKDIGFLQVIYAVLSLTLIRMLPVAISLIGKHLRRGTVLFLGWFGPRGLASIVLGLMVVEETPQFPGLEQIQLIVITTVLFSVFAHGASANRLIAAYSRHTETMSEKAHEKEKAAELPTRAKQ